MNIWNELKEWDLRESRELPESVCKWVSAHGNRDWTIKVETLLRLCKESEVRNEFSEKPSKRVAFYSLRELHLPILLAVAKVLKTEFAGKNIEIGFCAPEYKEGREGFPEEGLKPSTLQRLFEEGWNFWGSEMPSVAYDAVVTADACNDRIENWGPVVCVGHGTISKNIYFINNVLARRESFHAALCVPGPWYVDSFKGEVHTEIIATGFPKMDELAKDYENLKNEIFELAHFNPQKKTILFAPTYNLELTGMAILAEEWGRLDRNKYQVLVKLHGATDPQLVQLYKRLSSLLQGFMYFVEDQNLAPYLKMCDILISDVSSAYVEGYAVGIPVIVVDNPEMYTFSGYNPEAVEFKVRDGAYRLQHGRELHRILQQLEQGLDPLKSLRERYAKELFTLADGQNSRRVCEVILKVLSREIVKKPSQQINVIVLRGANVANVLSNMDKMSFPCRIFAEDALEAAQIPRCEPIDNLDRSERTIILEGTHQFQMNWDEVYDLCLRYHPEVEYLGPLFDEGDSEQKQDYVQVLNKRVNGEYELRRWFLKYTQFSHAIAHQVLSIDGLLINTPQSKMQIIELIERNRINKFSLIGHICLGQLGKESDVENRDTLKSMLYQKERVL